MNWTKVFSRLFRAKTRKTRVILIKEEKQAVLDDRKFHKLKYKELSKIHNVSISTVCNICRGL